MTTHRKVRRAPGIYQRGADKTKLTIKIPLGRDPKTGRKIDAEHPFRGSLADAKIERGRLLAKRKDGEYIKPSGRTVADHLRDWIKRHQRSLAAKTAEGYREIIETHLIPALGAHRLDKLAAIDVQTALDQALSAGRRCTKKDGTSPQGLAANTVRNHFRVLNQALQEAVDLDVLPKNPCARVKRPRGTDSEMKILDQPTMARLLREIENLAIYVPVLLAATTGMRRGEVLGLRWKDVDLDAGALTVNQSLQQTKPDPAATDELARRGLSFKAPKTQRSRRRIFLYPYTVEALRRHKVRQAEHRLSIGLGRDELGLVCALADGSPRSPRELTKEFRRVTRRLGLDVRLHDLRHSHVTHLLAEPGVNVRTVADRVGHASAKMTLDRYAHTLPGTDKAASDSAAATLQTHMKE